MERVAFFCSTPFQVIVALTIMDDWKARAVGDIYVVNHFRGATELIDRLASTDLFRRAVLVDGAGYKESLEAARSAKLRKVSILRQAQKGLQYFRYQRVVKQYVDLPEEAYDTAFLSYPDLIVQLALKELHDRNMELQIHLFEDGVGGYGTEIATASRRKRLFNFVTGYGRVVDAYTELHVFKPELVSGRTRIPTRKLPVIAENSALVRLLNSLFVHAAEGRISQRFIVLEQPFDFVEGLNDEVAEIIHQVLPVGDTVVKLHPRSSSELYAGMSTYPSSETPWEIITLNNDLSGKVLVSIFSSAAMTSNILANQEPQIIFLFDIPNVRTSWKLPDSLREMGEKFRASYSDSSRIHIPQTIQELKVIVERLCREESRVDPGIDREQS